MVERSHAASLAWTGLALLAILLFAANAMAAADAGELSRIILLHSAVPRASVAIAAGAALGLSGLLLQRILRNPLAEPCTLGISAGAQLALTLASLQWPALITLSPQAVAFAGGIAAIALVLALSWSKGLEPVAVVLAGMMISLTATAASATLILANGEYLFSLFIWGGGSLVQQGWSPTISIATQFVLVVGLSWLLVRPLTILGLDDASASGLGVRNTLYRLLVILLAVWLATAVVAELGIIAFIGLAAPALAKLSGVRTLRRQVIIVPLLGAVLLWVTDGLLQAFSAGGAGRIPAGAATALLGGPLLLWLLPRLRLIEWPNLEGPIAGTARLKKPAAFMGMITVAAMAAAGASLLAGMGPQGWSLAGFDAPAALIGWRWPHVAVAAAAGVLLALSGVLIQRLTANPLASPELLGVGTGAGAGLAAVLFVAPAAALGLQLIGSVAGAAAGLGIILAFAAQAKLGPERLLFAGIAVNALCSSVLTAVIALGQPLSFTLLRWLSGSTSDVSKPQALMLLAAAGLMLAAVLPLRRWLEILPMGSETAAALGLGVPATRLTLIGLAAAACAVAALFVGPLSFVGLIAPHAARLMGFRPAGQQLLASAALGALLMIVADWLSRQVAFPYLLPLGLFASLLGGSYLIILLSRGVPRHV